MSTPVILVVFGSKNLPARLIAFVNECSSDAKHEVHMYRLTERLGVEVNMTRLNAKNIILVGRQLATEILGEGIPDFQITQKTFLKQRRKFLVLPLQGGNSEDISESIEKFKGLAE